jgi:hypothetical protein
VPRNGINAADKTKPKKYNIPRTIVPMNMFVETVASQSSFEVKSFYLVQTTKSVKIYSPHH